MIIGRFSTMHRIIVFLITITSLVCASTVQSQLKAGNTDSQPRVVLRKLFPPVYPQMASIAGVAGDVNLQVLVHPDGTIEIVRATSGHPILIQAALESARKSQFDCWNCDAAESRSLIYAFRLSGQAPDPCCCSCNPASLQVDHFTVSQGSNGEDYVTVTASPVCVCPDACTLAWAKAHPKRVRSAKCLYLWKCGARTLGVY